MQAIRKCMWAAGAAVSAAIFMPTTANAALTIGLSKATISNSGNELVNVVVTNITAPDSTITNIQGLDIYLQVENGGVDNGAASNPHAATVNSLDLTTGVFSGPNNSGGNAGYFEFGDGMLLFDSVQSNSISSVPQNKAVVVGSVLGTLSLDAHTLSNGDSFRIYFENVGADSGFSQSSSDYTNSAGVPVNFVGPDFTNPPSGAQLTVVTVPEPGCVGFAGVVAGASLLGRRRRSVAR